jgi:hypothetical protein
MTTGAGAGAPGAALAAFRGGAVRTAPLTVPAPRFCAAPLPTTPSRRALSDMDAERGCLAGRATDTRTGAARKFVRPPAPVMAAALRAELAELAEARSQAEARLRDYAPAQGAGRGRGAGRRGAAAPPWQRAGVHAERASEVRCTHLRQRLAALARTALTRNPLAGWHAPAAALLRSRACRQGRRDAGALQRGALTKSPRSLRRLAHRTLSRRT